MLLRLYRVDADRNVKGVVTLTSVFIFSFNHFCDDTVDLLSLVLVQLSQISYHRAAQSIIFNLVFPQLEQANKQTRASSWFSSGYDLKNTSLVGYLFQHLSS